MATHTLIVGNVLGTGGVETLTESYCALLNELGLTPLLALRSRGHFRFPSTRAQQITYCHALRLCLTRDVQRILVMPDSRARILAFAAQTCGVTTFFLLDSTRVFQPAPAHSWRKLLTQIIEKTVLSHGRVLPTYSAVRIKALEAGAEVTDIVNNPVTMPAAARRVRQRVSEPLRVLYVGRLEPEKGVDYLLSVARELRCRKVPYELRSVGDGSMREHLVRAASDLTPGNDIFLRSCVDPSLHYEWADILLVPSRSEGPSQVAAEAITNGVPVVCFQVDGAGPTETAGLGGLTVPQGDCSAMVDAILKIAADYSRYSQAAVAASMRFTIGSSSRQLAGVLGLRAAIRQ